MTPEQRRRYLGARKPRATQPRVCQGCCACLQKRARRRRRIKTGRSALPPNFLGFDGLTRLSEARGVPLVVLQSAVASKQLPAFKCRGRWRVSYDDFDTWRARWERMGGRRAS
jgi:hypothetical protein